MRIGRTRFEPRLRLAAMFVLAFLAGIPAPHLRAQEYARHQVEAAYLVNFIRYTEWPPESAPPPEAPIVVVVYRAPGTADSLEAIAEGGERIAGREIEVRRARSEERLAREIGGAHVLYVGQGVDPVPVLAHVGEHVLTVGAAEGFSAQGGMLGLVPADGRVVFDANLGAIRASGLSLSARVLALARHVEGTR